MATEGLGGVEDLAELDQLAVAQAHKDLEYYRTNARRAQGFNLGAESLLLAVSASVPAVIAIWPDQHGAAAALGALVVVLTGCRSLFHWKETYVRFSRAFVTLDRELASFTVGALRYSDPATRGRLLVEASNRVALEETSAWAKLNYPKPDDTS